MPGLVGMDVEAVEQLGHSLQQQADAIEQVICVVNGLVSDSQNVWKGTDANQFAEWWMSQHRPALQQVREAISGLGQSALNNAAQQREISAR